MRFPFNDWLLFLLPPLTLLKECEAMLDIYFKAFVETDLPKTLEDEPKDFYEPLQLS